MSLDKLSVVESNISQLIERFSTLKEEKNYLAQRVITLESELEEQKKETDQYKEKSESAEVVKEENARLQEAQQAASTKIEAILQRLEESDLGD